MRHKTYYESFLLLIPLENSSISDSEPLQRAHSGFSRDASHMNPPAVTHEPLLALSPQLVGERCGELIDAAKIPAEAGLSSLKRLTIRKKRFPTVSDFPASEKCYFSS